MGMAEDDYVRFLGLGIDGIDIVNEGDLHAPQGQSQGPFLYPAFGDLLEAFPLPVVIAEDPRPVTDKALESQYGKRSDKIPGMQYETHLLPVKKRDGLIDLGEIIVRIRKNPYLHGFITGFKPGYPG